MNAMLSSIKLQLSGRTTAALFGMRFPETTALTDGKARFLLAVALLSTGVWVGHIIALLYHGSAGFALLISASVASVLTALFVAGVALFVAPVRSAFKSLVERHQLLEIAVNNMAQGLVMFGSDGKLLLHNSRYLEMYGLSGDDLRPGTSLRELVSLRMQNGLFNGNPDEHCAKHFEAVRQQRAWSAISEDSNDRIIQRFHRPLLGGGWVSTHEDITDREKAKRQLEYLARTDPLTGLPNRNSLAEKIRSRVASSASDFALIFLDLDHFKEINDTFGHSVGDRFLQVIAARLSKACGEDFIARMGGDELAVIEPSIESLDELDGFIEHVQNVIAKPVRIDGHYLQTSATAGVAIYPRHGEDSETLIRHADAALYRAKNQARGSRRTFDEGLAATILTRRVLHEDLKVAVENHLLNLVYQPQARPDGPVIGFEVLLRWHHPVHGEISPQTFIALAEQTGLILPISEWVIETACREAATWHSTYSVSVNISPAQFMHANLVETVRRALLSAGLEAHRLELEITEGVLLADDARAERIMRELRDLGVGLALDDFGTGYASVAYVSQFPFTALKIDRYYIRDLDRGRRSQAIVRSLVELGQALDMKVVAEGVETAEQLAFLADLHCDAVQGFLIGRPSQIPNSVRAGRRT